MITESERERDRKTFDEGNRGETQPHRRYDHAAVCVLESYPGEKRKRTNTNANIAASIRIQAAVNTDDSD